VKANARREKADANSSEAVRKKMRRRDPHDESRYGIADCTLFIVGA
jgi:hypothetical protein